MLQDMYVVILWKKKIFEVTRGWPRQEMKELTALSCPQSAICYNVCGTHLKIEVKVSWISSRGVFRIIDDKRCRALCPGWFCCLRAKHILIAFPVWCMCVVSSSVALEPVEPWLLVTVRAHPPSSVSVHQDSDFSVTRQNLEQCGSCRGQRWVCPLHSWPSVSIGRKDPFLLYYLLLPPVQGEGKSCKGRWISWCRGQEGWDSQVWGFAVCCVGFLTLWDAEGRRWGWLWLASPEWEQSRVTPGLIGLGRIPGQSYRNDVRQFLLQSFCSWLPP